AGNGELTVELLSRSASYELDQALLLRLVECEAAANQAVHMIKENRLTPSANAPAPLSSHPHNDFLEVTFQNASLDMKLYALTHWPTLPQAALPAVRDAYQGKLEMIEPAVRNVLVDRFFSFESVPQSANEPPNEPAIYL